MRAALDSWDRQCGFLGQAMRTAVFCCDFLGQAMRTALA